MQMNPDCIRSVLLVLESRSSYRSLISFNADSLSCFEELKNYDLCTVLYHIQKCDEAGFLEKVYYYPEQIDTEGLHYRGHQFLASIKDDKNWKSVKKGLDAVKNYSLSAIGSVAEGVTTAAINAYFSGLANP